MNIMGLMLVREEDWILGTSARAALKWVDSLMIVEHHSEDQTELICANLEMEYPDRVHLGYEPDIEHWDEMQMRDRMLVAGRDLGATHFAIIDADEILTANNLANVRGWFLALRPGQILDVPMIPMRGLYEYQHDGSVWSRAKLTLGFRDDSHLTHRPGKDGYEHHNRPPHGCRKNRHTPSCDGGTMHLQFSNKRRLISKHILYRMVDHLRWPGRESVKRLNQKYDAALQDPTELQPVPWEWVTGYQWNKINLHGVPWQENRIKGLLELHGRESFAGLDLKGF